MKKLFSILTAAAVMASMAAVPASAAEYGTLTMDTQSYIMAPGDIYDFRAKVEGGDLRQEEVVVSDSRTGSVVQLSRVPGTDKYRIKAVNEGVCWVVAEVRGTHASIRVEVKKGAVQCGVATRSITQVPISSSSADNNNTSSESDGSSGGSATVIDITPEGANEGGGFTVDVRYPEGTPVIDADTEDEDVPEGINEARPGSTYGAAEIFAADIQDYDRGLLIGGTTAGYGVQTEVAPLSDGSAVILPTARYIRVDGTEIHGAGISPDMEISLNEEQQAQFNRESLALSDDPQALAAVTALMRQGADVAEPPGTVSSSAEEPSGDDASGAESSGGEAAGTEGSSGTEAAAESSSAS